MLLAGIVQCLVAQKTNVYLFPGQGSDERLFSRIRLDSNFNIVHIVYPVPAKGTSMKEYARLLGTQIDTGSSYILVGVSMGGMLCSELKELMHPKQVIIISSAKCRSELPFRYRFQKTIPINKLVPKGLMKLGARILQPIVEPDRKKNKEVFKSMLKKKSPVYYKRTVNMIINWDRKACTEDIVHIHGTKDHTIPIRNVRCTHKIDKGSHMMTLTRGDEMNLLLLSILRKQP